jgi:endonuclease YncB( thermonuclease family)
MRRIPLALILALLAGVALADDFVGQASVIDGDTLEVHGTRIRLWGVDAPESSQLCRGEDSLQHRCGAQAANSLDAFIARRPVNCIPLSLDQYGARSRPVRSMARTSANGSCGAAWRWTGLNTRKAGMARRSRTPSTPVEESGRAVTSSRGSIALASARTESRLPVRMTQTLIPDWQMTREPSRSRNWR